MSSGEKGSAASKSSPSPHTAKEKSMMDVVSSASSPQTAVVCATSLQSNISSESNMQSIPDRQSVDASRSPIFNRISSVSRSATAQTAKKPSIRFVTSILVLISMNICLMVALHLTIWNLVVSRMLASILSPFVAFFGYQWCHYYSIALTRKKRAFWVEPNILLTYQPRARYSGHLFKPDPPTPGVTDRDIASLTPVDQLAALQSQEDEGKKAEIGNEEGLEETAKRKAFIESRKQFYGGEWAAAMKGLQDRTATITPSAQTESLFDQPSDDVKSKQSSAASSSTASTNIAPSLSIGRLNNQKKSDENNAANAK